MRWKKARFEQYRDWRRTIRTMDKSFVSASEILWEEYGYVNAR